MGKEEDEKGSFVDPSEVKDPTPQNLVLMEKITNALECTAKVLSGIGVTLVTVKTAIDENTKAYIQAREELNSLVTLLVVGKDKKVDPKPEQKVTQVTGPTPTPPPTTTPEAGPTPTPPPTTTPEESEKTAEIDKIRMTFPNDLEAMLNFEDKGDFITIKPKQFLGSENFAKIASAVRAMGGEYISAGRDSHFRVFKKNGK